MQLDAAGHRGGRADPGPSRLGPYLRFLDHLYLVARGDAHDYFGLAKTAGSGLVLSLISWTVVSENLAASR